MVDAGARVVHEEPAGIHYDLSGGIERNIGAIHGARGWALEIYTLAVVTAAVARALEFIFRGLPFGRAAEMRATGEDDEEAIRLADDPDAIGHQKALVNSETEIGGKADIKSGIGLVQSAGKEKPEEHQEVHAEVAPNTGPYNSAAARIDGLRSGLRFGRLRRGRRRRYWRLCGLSRLPFGNFCHRPVEIAIPQTKS